MRRPEVAWCQGRDPAHRSIHLVAAHPRHRRDIALVGALTLLALGTSLYTLGRKGLWWDEIYSVGLAEQSWHQVWHTITQRELNMASYHVALWLWLHVGDSVAFARLLSVAAAVASVPIVFATGRRLFGLRVALLAALLLAVSGFFVQYAQEARAYALVLLAVSVSTYAFVRMVETPARRWTALFVIATVVGFYGHFFVMFVTAAQLASLFVLPRGQRPWRAVSVSVGAIVVLLVPFLVHVATKGGSQIRGFPPLEPRDIARVGKVIVGGRDVTKLSQAELDPGLPLLALYGTAVAVFLVQTWRAWRSDGERAWGRVLVGAWFVVPIVVALVGSYVVQPMFEARYFITTLPPLVLMTAVVLAQMASRRWAIAGLAALVVFSGCSLYLWYQRDQKDEWHAAVATVLDRTRRGDGVFFMDGNAWGAFDFYASRDFAGRPRPASVYPRFTWGTYDVPTVDVPHFTTTELTRLTQPYDRMWLVVSHGSFGVGVGDQTELVQSYFDRRWRPVLTRQLVDVSVALYEHEPRR